MRLHNVGLKPNKMIEVLGERYFDSTDMPGEIWIDLPASYGESYSHTYTISNKGRVKNYIGCIMGGDIDFAGYHKITLHSPSGSHTYSVHRLVLMMFGQHLVDSEMLTVQHINHDKLDNRIENLCWMLPEDNNRDGHGPKIHLLDTDQYFDSRVLASYDIGRAAQYITECMQHGKTIVAANGHEIRLEYLLPGETVWRLYVPKLSVWTHGPRSCKIVDSSGTHLFSSIYAADKYLGQYDGYIRSKIKHHTIIYNSSNEQVEFSYIDTSKEE